MQQTDNIIGKGSTFQYDNSIIQKYDWSICALSPLLLSVYHTQLRSSYHDVAVFFIGILSLLNFVNYFS